MKKCNKCELEKPINLFNKNPDDKTGYRSFCKECDKDYFSKHYKVKKEYIKEKSKLWKQNNKDKRDAYNKLYKSLNKEKIAKTNRRCLLKKEYNITLEQYDSILESQYGCCAICGKHQSELKKTLAVDHDHKENKARGLLCDRCNTSIGQFEESIPLLLKAIEYIKYWSDENKRWFKP